MSVGSVSPSYRNRISRRIDHWFPTPRYLLPLAAGVDISDASIKWMTLKEAVHGYEVAAWGTKALSSGIVVGGIIKDMEGLVDALSGIKYELAGAQIAHAALPEEAAYVFSMQVPDGNDREQTLRMIEFELDGRVPIPPSAAVYDFSTIERHDGEGHGEIAVSVFPRDLSESYAHAFREADIELMSLEVEARSIGRAVSSREAGEAATFLVDFGRARTGFAVLERGIPIFTSTVDIGGDTIQQAVSQALSIPAADAERFCNEEGLMVATGRSLGAEAIARVAVALTAEIKRHYRYWDTRRSEKGERRIGIDGVVLVGGSANLNGLPEYIAGHIHAPVELADIWHHICDFDHYIPPIDRKTSLQFATAAGLALRTL